MRCHQLRSLSTRYLDGELDPQWASAARGHMRDCEACRRAVEDEARVVEAARSIPSTAEPAGGWDQLWQRIEAKVADEERADAALSRWSLWWRAQRERVAMAVAGLAAATAVVVLAPRSSGPGEADEASSSASAPSRSAPEPFLDRAHRQVVEADRHYAATIAELRALIDRERAHWSLAREAEVDARLAELDERAARARRELAVIGLPEPHERDELYAIYREEISFLQRAVTGAPIASAHTAGGGKGR